MTRDLSNFRNPCPPATFHTGPGSEMFPLPSIPEQVETRTVFTTYAIPQRSAAAPYAPPVHAALCACGDTTYADSEAYLRKVLGEHSCAARRDQRVELVPIDDDPDTDVLARVLSGLRDLS